MFTFTITPDAGETYEIRATSRDLYTWEHGGRNRNLQTLQAELSMTSLYQLAFIAGRRLGLIEATVTLPDWVQSHDLDFEQDDEPDPTQPAR